MPGVPRVATRDTVIDDGEEEERGGMQKKQKKILEGQTVFIATSKAAMDPKAFPEPEKLDPYRPLSSYILLGHVSVFFFPSFPHFFFLSFFSRKGDSIGPSFLLRSSTRRTCSRGNFETSFQIEKSSTRGGA